jgi:hypothetical protein
MKICPNCKTENEDKYIFCTNCKRTLPRISQLEKYMVDGMHYYDKEDYRKAMENFESLLKLNIGNKDAWLMKGLTLMKMNLMREAYNCFESAGVKYATRRCEDCGGFKRCGECGGTGTCNMCGGRRKCMMCEGNGECPSCRATMERCKMCGGTQKCIRCKGTGECTYCNGIGACGKCHGNAMCAKCGGTGKQIDIDGSSVSRDIRKYLK